MSRVSVSLGASGIRRIRAEVESLRRNLPAIADEICRRLGEVGVATAVEVVPVDTGQLAGSIGLLRRGPRDYLVVADGEYAAFVEFGTGVVGSGTYPGELPDGWRYDVRWSPWAHDVDDPSAWYYVDQDGVRHKTRGQQASGFMASAAEEMRRKAVAIAREVVASCR